MTNITKYDILKAVNAAYKTVTGAHIENFDSNLLSTVSTVDAVYIIHFLEKALGFPLNEFFSFDPNILIPNILADTISKNRTV